MQLHFAVAELAEIGQPIEIPVREKEQAEAPEEQDERRQPLEPVGPGGTSVLAAIAPARASVNQPAMWCKSSE